MCGNKEDILQSKHSFLCQGVFERRKTQYQLFLFFLGAAGACAGAVLGTKDPERRLLVLLVPALLQIPIYISWWYQRNQIDVLDKKREQIDSLPPWQDPILKYSNDIIMIVTPLVLIGLAAYVLQSKSLPVRSNSDFRILLSVSATTSLASVAMMVGFGVLRYYRRKKEKQLSKQS